MGERSRDTGGSGDRGRERRSHTHRPRDDRRRERVLSLFHRWPRGTVTEAPHSPMRRGIAPEEVRTWTCAAVVRAHAMHRAGLGVTEGAVPLAASPACVRRGRGFYTGNLIVI
jgi:hypothetical protein